MSTASGQVKSARLADRRVLVGELELVETEQARLRSNHLRAIGYASSVALIIASTVSSSSSLSMFVGCIGFA